MPAEAVTIRGPDGATLRSMAKGWLFGGGQYLSAGDTRYVLAAIDLDAESPSPSLVELPFLPHAMSVDPRDGVTAAVFEKQGPGAALVDLATMTVRAPIETPPTRAFYGHGAHAPDGAVLYATETHLDAARGGAVVVRDATTLRELGVVPTHGASPHDCMLVEGGAVMIVANGGGALDGRPPSVTYVEVATGRLLDDVRLDDATLNAGHLALGPAGELVLVSAPRQGQTGPDARGGVSLRRGPQLSRLSAPPAVAARMTGETLSVLVDVARREVLATQPTGHFVTRWGLDDGELRGAIELTNPRGLARSLDDAWVLVAHSTARSVRLTALDARTLAPVGWWVEPSFVSGSHAAVHALSPSVAAS